MQILYTSDLHGNQAQYEAVISYALTNSIDAIIIGGDLAPKDLPGQSYIQGQREFLEFTLPRLVAPLPQSCKVYV